jgi:hypothetical protein
VNLPAGAGCTSGGASFSGGYFTGTDDNAAAAIGAFWAIGQYNPAPAAGQDNGTWVPNNGGVADDDWIRVLADPYLAGDWASATGVALADGCIQDPPNPQPGKMAFAFSMGGAVPGTTAYAAGCVEEAGDAFIYNASDRAAGIIPKPVVASTSRTATSVTVNLAPPALGGGIYDDGSCGLAIGSYKVYRRSEPTNGPAPVDRGRVSGGWTQVGGTFAPNAGASVTVDCTAPADVYLAYSLIITDNGQGGTGSSPAQAELGHVGQNATVVRCNSTAAIEPNNFKIIKKPVRTKTK